MPKFRKKPVVIEAWLFDGSWESAAPIVAKDDAMMWTPSDGGQIMVATLEGEMTASAGDWIIKGIKGEFYPCRADIFAASYDPERTP